MSARETSEVPRLSLLSSDVREERLAFLREVVPEAFTDGKLDPARLGAALGDGIEPGPERYGLTWKGKAECVRLAQRTSSATLRPDREASVDWESTENVVIEGDNLEVLKLLQRGYAGKVKVIYIDPPYNTGKEFLYSDNFREPLRQYLIETGQIAPDSRRATSEEDTSGRLHSRWLSMMWPRLWLARNLLTDDGSLWISIDDHEVHALRAIGNEVFGDESFVCNFVWQKRTTRENRASFSTNHDHVLCFARNAARFAESRGLLPFDAAAEARYANPDGDPRGPWQSVSLNAQAGHATPSQFYTIVTPSGRRLDPPEGRCWSVTEPKLKELVADGRIWFGAGGANVPRRKLFLSEARDGLTPHTLWTADEAGTTDVAKKELLDAAPGSADFDTPKPIALMRRILTIAGDPGALVLDFFAGSGTTGDAVMRLNAEDGGKRRFLLVQYPEPTSQPAYATIADITRARLRATKKTLDARDAPPQPASPAQHHHPQDRGFRSYKLASSNFRIWDSDAAPRDPAALARQLPMFVDPLLEDRSPEDVVTEILLKSGAGERVVAPLSDRVEERTLAGRRVFATSFAGADPLLFVCLERPLDREVFRAMMDAGAEQIVVLDAGFMGNDALKANVALELAARDVQLRTV